ncbi:uncharacterized protein [Panulirus ornatus]|uniref:uncharacterized protein isoform X2 n=1 Tax=Panulirus ornatus TaxID=150431 RepID=UPI003A85A4C9
MLSLRIRRKLPLVLCCLIVIFLIMKRGKQQRHFEMFIPDQEPKAVWDVLADFSNMPHLNTRIQRWQLVEESGNFDRWTYRVVTYETMVGGFLLGLNENHGEVVVEPVSPPDHYHLQEVYTTYSLHGWLVDNVACGASSDADQAVVGLTTLPNKKKLLELWVRELALTGSHMERNSVECDSGSVVVYSTCDVSSYICREAVPGVSAGGCQDLYLEKDSKSVYCQSNMAVVKIAKDGSQVDGITCCPVVGW